MEEPHNTPPVNPGLSEKVSILEARVLDLESTVELLKRWVENVTEAPIQNAVQTSDDVRIGK